MPAKSVAVTSPLTGPFTMSQIFFRFWRKSPGSFASSDGFVVTPSMMPMSDSFWMSAMLPESMNSFMAGSLRLVHDGVDELADPFDLHGYRVAGDERPDAFGRARRDDVARFERHDERDVFHDQIE